MAKKLLYNFQVVGALYVGAGGPEVQAGDEVRLFLDQTRNPSFPESIDAIVQLPVKRVTIMSGQCPQEGTSYTFEYESDDLNGAADHLDACDIKEVSGITCCVSLREALDEEIAAREATQADLDTWDVIEASAAPVNGAAGTRQVETNTGVGTITTAGLVEFDLTSALVTKVVQVSVLLGDTPTQWVERVAQELEADSDVSEHFEVDNISAEITLTAKVAAANDPTFQFTMRDGTSVGLGAGTTSVPLTPGAPPSPGSPLAERLGQHAHYQGRIFECVQVDPVIWHELVRRADVSTGGQGSSDDAKVLAFLGSGAIKASAYVDAVDSGTPEYVARVIGSQGSQGVTFFQDAETVRLLAPAATADRDLTLPDSNGVLALAKKGFSGATSEAGTYVVDVDARRQNVTLTGTVNDFTIQLPQIPSDGFEVEIYFSGAISSSITFDPQDLGKFILGAPATIAADQVVTVTFNAAANSWVVKP